MSAVTGHITGTLLSTPDRKGSSLGNHTGAASIAESGVSIAVSEILNSRYHVASVYVNCFSTSAGIKVQTRKYDEDGVSLDILMYMTGIARVSIASSESTFAFVFVFCASS